MKKKIIRTKTMDKIFSYLERHDKIEIKPIEIKPKKKPKNK